MASPFVDLYVVPLVVAFVAGALLKRVRGEVAEIYLATAAASLYVLWAWHLSNFVPNSIEIVLYLIIEAFLVGLCLFFGKRLAQLIAPPPKT